MEYRTRLCVSRPGGGLAGKCAKVVGGGLHEGGGFPLDLFTIINMGVA